jgi:hypothetical protein
MKTIIFIFVLSLLTLFVGQTLGQDLIIYPARGMEIATASSGGWSAWGEN